MNYTTFRESFIAVSGFIARIFNIDSCMYLYTTAVKVVCRFLQELTWYCHNSCPPLDRNGYYLNISILWSSATYFIDVHLRCFLFVQGRLNELMSQLRMQNHMGGLRSESSYQMDESVQQEIRQVCYIKSRSQSACNKSVMIGMTILPVIAVQCVPCLFSLYQAIIQV